MTSAIVSVWVAVVWADWEAEVTRAKARVEGKVEERK